MWRVEDEQYQRLERLLRTYQLRSRNKREEATVATAIARELDGVCMEIEREINDIKQKLERESREAMEATMRRAAESRAPAPQRSPRRTASQPSTLSWMRAILHTPVGTIKMPIQLPWQKRKPY
jgi:hypothetical protein